MSDDIVGAAPGRVELPLETEDFLVWLASERGRSRNTVMAAYRELLAVYEGLYPALRDAYAALAAFRRKEPVR